MIECYFKWCKWHHNDEPFCTKSKCIATSAEIEHFRELREQELLKGIQDGGETRTD